MDHQLHENNMLWERVKRAAQISMIVTCVVVTLSFLFMVFFVVGVPRELTPQEVVARELKIESARNENWNVRKELEEFQRQHPELDN